MKLRDPRPEEPQYVTIIDDVDGEGVETTYHHDLASAEAHLGDQYEGIPVEGEPGAETYTPGETPNAKLEVVRVLVCRVLRRVLV